MARFADHVRVGGPSRVVLRRAISSPISWDRVYIDPQPSDEPFFPPGLYNLGNTCFMNSVIQAVCSLPPLFEFLRDRCYQYYSADVPDPADGSEKKPLLVTEALLDLVVALNSMDRTRRVLKPSEFIAALAATSKGNRRLMCYEQQDAHELLQILSSSLTDEEAPGPPLVLSLFDLDSLKAEAPGLPLSLKRADSKPVPPPGKKTQLKRRRSRTLVAEGFTLFPNLPQNLRNPFTGLLAHSMSCLVCGYRPEVRHDTFDNISLAVPHASATSVQALLNSYVSHEDIEGYACARCILIATVQSISKDIEVLKEQIAAVSQKAKKETSDQLRNKRKDDLRILLNELRDQEQNRRLVEYAARFDVEKKLVRSETAHAKFVGHLTKTSMQPVTIKKAKVTSAHAQKQILIAHPPQVLCLHMQRSVYTPSGVVYKNNCRVKFDPILDLTPFCSYMGGSIANASPVAAERLMEIQAELERRRAALRNALDADSSDNQQSQAESSKPTTQRSKRRSSGNKRSGLRGGAATNDLDGDDDAERSSLTLDGVNSLVEGSDSSIAVPNGDTATANEKEDRAAPTTYATPSPPRHLYRLHAVVLHHGSHDSGHFVTFRRAARGESKAKGGGGEEGVRWFRISDDHVDIVTDVRYEVFEAGGANAYMLFYERI
ncbi:hypothetical protein DFJ73DRAFT_623902 [Zopfochytrium polystomum]|nr:hypothetical protein DFJ73DRAFT_623902 [Zopfochytrium polystomum]